MERNYPARPNDQVKFAAYTREDGVSGLDYADQRYYSSTLSELLPSTTANSGVHGLVIEAVELPTGKRYFNTFRFAERKRITCKCAPT